MSSLKPFIRVTILSCVLSLLLIYLGIQYHWGDYLKPGSQTQVTLTIPAKPKDIEVTELVKPLADTYNPELLENTVQSTILDSMNKEQMTEYCKTLFGKEIRDSILLELASVNCVVSNYQETYQSIDEGITRSDAEIKEIRQLRNQCAPQFIQSDEYTPIEKALLIGVCVSDGLNAQ